MKHNHKGFGAHGLILAIGLIIGISVAGWYVWKANDKNSPPPVSTGPVEMLAPVIDNYADCLKSDSSTMKKGAFPKVCISDAGKQFVDPNPYAKWKKYSTATGKYSLRHPATWREDVCDPAATDLVLYLGPTKASSAICASEHPSQVMVVSTPSVPTASEQELSGTYTDKKSKNVKVDGVSGTRRSGTLSVAENFGIPLPVGTIGVSYVFLVPGRSYIFIYTQAPSGDFSANNLKYFDAMVEDTVKFSN